MNSEQFKKLSKQDQFTYLIYYLLFKVPKSSNRDKIKLSLDKIKRKIMDFEGFEIFCYEHEAFKTYIATNKDFSLILESGQEIKGIQESITEWDLLQNTNISKESNTMLEINNNSIKTI